MRTTIVLACLVFGCGASPSATSATADPPAAGEPDRDAAIDAPGASPTRDGGASPDAAAPCSGGVTLARVHGNGALALPGNWSSAVLAVRATACGKPKVGASVAFGVTQGTGVLSADPNTSPATTLEATTDASGIATAVFRHPGPMNNTLQSNEPGQVEARVGSASVTFAVPTFNACQVTSCGSGVFYPYA